HGKEKRKAKAGRVATLALVSTKVDTHHKQDTYRPRSTPINSNAVRSPGRSREPVEGGVAQVVGA
ncbi:hypothetical protein, partial [Stenotrophomonas sp. GD03794]|uniref:hypothetical protein n=2 Tax=unclassified Stenotrophomonas TaxID=196198 RepID=UPI00244C4011